MVGFVFRSGTSVLYEDRTECSSLLERVEANLTLMVFAQTRVDVMKWRIESCHDRIWSRQRANTSRYTLSYDTGDSHARMRRA